MGNSGISGLNGPIAALLCAAIWAFASTRYAAASRALGSSGVSLVRTLVVLPLFAIAVLVLGRTHQLGDLHLQSVLWLLGSVLCSYALADGLFFSAARRLGTSTALSIGSCYPIWAALVGALCRGEPFGWSRISGTLICVGGVVSLIQLARPRGELSRPSLQGVDRIGVLLALTTSILWAGNTVAVKYGAVGLHPLQANLVRYLLAAPILAVSVAILRPPSVERQSKRSAYRLLVPVSLAEAFVGSTLFVYALAHTDLVVGATLCSMAPLMSVPFAIWSGEERWSRGRATAIAATVAGVIILIRAG